MEYELWICLHDWWIEKKNNIVVVVVVFIFGKMLLNMILICQNCKNVNTSICIWFNVVYSRI